MHPRSMKKLLRLLRLIVCLLSSPAFAVDLNNTRYQDFDQSLGHGWRALADQKRFVEAARLIEAFLGEHPELEARNRANLDFHAAQCLAFEGSAASIAEALAHLRDSHVNPEPPELPIRWNDYVTATEAFLKGDLPVLKAARDRIAAGPKWNGELVNLEVVDKLISKFGKSYAEAYGMKTSKEQKAVVRPSEAPGTQPWRIPPSGTVMK